MQKPVALDFVSTAVAGVAAAHATGNPDLLQCLTRSSAALPKDLLASPLLLEIRTQRAPQLRYLLWAAWLPPDVALQPELQPLTDFHGALSPYVYTHPSLLLARAESRFDTPPAWDPRFSHLMDERNPHQATEGRLLLLAAQTGQARGTYPGQESPAAHLVRGLQCFYAALSGCPRSILPEGCFVARSGFRALTITGRPTLRVVPGTPSAGGILRPVRPPGKAVAIQNPLGIQAQVNGLLVWGAWRGDSGIRRESTRFLAQSVRADKATRVQYTVQAADSLRAPEWARAVAEALGLESHPGATEAIAERTAAALSHAVQSDGQLGHSLRKPYQLLLEQTVTQAPLLAQAFALPETQPLPDGDCQPTATVLASAGLRSLYDFLARKRDLPLLLSPRRRSETHVWNQRGSTKAA